MIRELLILMTLAAAALAQPSASTVGTVVAVRAQTGEIELKSDKSGSVIVSVTPETLVQRVTPGAADLKSAEAATLVEVSAGDRVLVTFRPGTLDARRIVVMPATAITKRNEADRQDWIRRGAAGVVAEKTASEIVLRMRSFRGESRVMVTVAPNTSFKRYAPDSVKFADARPSNLAEVAVGDQLRARGQKSEDGLTVAAQEVVFGTFLTKAGTISAVDIAAGEITIKDLITNKPLTVKVAADSQLKKMPGLPGPMAGGPGGAPRALGPRPGGPPDLTQMLEFMPAVKIEELKPGDTIVVSSTKGARADQITAIMLLANAEMLVRMASAQTGGRDVMNNNVGGLPTGLSSGGLAGLDLPGMIP